MSAFANLTLVDSAAANVVFSPQSLDSAGVAKWLTSDSIYDAKKATTMSVTLPKPGGTVTRIKQKIVIPIMDSVNTSLRIAEASIFIEAVIPKTASQTQRLDLRKHASTLLDNAVSTAAFTSLEAIY